MANISKWCESRSATCQAITALLGTMIGAFLAVYTTSYSVRHAADAARTASETSFQVAQIQLMQELEKKIDTDPVIRKMHAALVECNLLIPLKKEDTTLPNYVPYYEVNRFIAFLNNVGFYWKSRMLTYEMVDHLYGALIREAYLNNDLRTYIGLLGTNGRETDTGKYFLELGEKLVTDKQHTAHVTKWSSHDCTQRVKER